MLRNKLSLATVYALVALLSGFFLIYPLWGVIERTFLFNGHISPEIFFATLASPSVQNALTTSTLLALSVVALSILIAFPFAYINVFYTFPGKKLLAGIILIPMILPPFVGAIGLQRMLSRYGSLNALLGTTPFDWLGSFGFLGVACIEALHLFPIMYLNLTAAMANMDPAFNEAAALAGANRFKRLRDIAIPLAAPGFLSGMLIVFLWSFTDLGTPLVLNFRHVLPVEIFDRAVSVNNDPTGSAMVFLMMLITVVLIVCVKPFFTNDTLTASSKGSRLSTLHTPSIFGRIAIYMFAFAVFVAALLPHVGLVLTSIAQTWFGTVLPTEVTSEYFGAALSDLSIGQSVANSLLYSGVSTILDVFLGFFIAWTLMRNKIKGGFIIDILIMLPMALPGIIIAFGYVATFSGTILDPLKNPVPLLIIGYTIRRLPFTFRAAWAGLQQISPEYEDAARICGASPLRAVSQITVPLIGASIAAGAILSFLFAMLEVSESMVLAVKEQFFPITRQIYALISKIPDGDYVASALGVLCMVVLAVGIAIASILMGRQMGKMFRM